MDLLWTNSPVGHRLNQKATNCSPNSHRKCRRNVPRIFDVCWELKSDYKSCFGFFVDKFSEAVNTEITTFSIIAWSDCWSWFQVKKNASSFSFFLKENKMPDRRLLELRIPLLLIQNNLNNRFTFFTSNTPNTLRLDFLWAFSEQFQFTAGHLSFWD